MPLNNPSAVFSVTPPPVLDLVASTYNGTTWTDLVNPAGIFTATGAGVTKSAGYISFNGVDHLVGVAGAQPTIAVNKNVSLSMWINFTSFTATRPFDSGAADGNPGAFAVDMNPANNRHFFYSDNSNNFEYVGNLSHAVPTGEWHLWTWIFDRIGALGAPAGYIYFDGHLISTDASTAPFTTLQIGDGTQILHIGGGFSGGNLLTGFLGDIRMWNVALTASDVLSEYINSKPKFPAASPVAKQFPLANAVYVDLDAATLFAQGILDYVDIESALVSWRAGGAAQLAYGTPTADNPGLILVGAGEFLTGNTVNLDVDFLTIRGTSKESTKLKATGVLSGNVFFNPLASNIVVENMTMDPVGTSFAQNGCFINLGSGASSLTVRNILFTDFSHSALDNATSGQASDMVVENCDFVSTSIGNTPHAVIRFTGPFSSASRIENCSFNVATASGVFQMSPNDDVSCLIKNCTVINTIGTGLETESTPHYNGRIEGCTFICAGVCVNQITVGGKLLGNYMISTGANTNAVNTAASGVIIYGNRILGNGTGLAIDGSGFTLEVANNAVRNPTGDVANSFTNATLSPAFAAAFNAELLAATVD